MTSIAQRSSYLLPADPAVPTAHSAAPGGCCSGVACSVLTLLAPPAAVVPYDDDEEASLLALTLLLLLVVTFFYDKMSSRLAGLADAVSRSTSVMTSEEDQRRTT